jgi:hypothetical protein
LPDEEFVLELAPDEGGTGPGGWPPTDDVELADEIDPPEEELIDEEDGDEDEEELLQVLLELHELGVEPGEFPRDDPAGDELAADEDDDELVSSHTSLGYAGLLPHPAQLAVLSVEPPGRVSGQADSH